jgi:hypothetical protein
MMAGAAMNNCLSPLHMESGTDAKAFFKGPSNDDFIHK